MRTVFILLSIMLLTLPAHSQILAKRTLRDSLSRRNLVLEQEHDYDVECYSIIDATVFYSDNTSFFAYYVFFKSEKYRGWLLYIDLSGHRMQDGLLPSERYLRLIPLHELDFTKPGAILDRLQKDKSLWLRREPVNQLIEL